MTRGRDQKIRRGGQGNVHFSLSAAIRANPRPTHELTPCSALSAMTLPARGSLHEKGEGLVSNSTPAETEHRQQAERFCVRWRIAY